MGLKPSNCQPNLCRFTHPELFPNGKSRFKVRSDLPENSGTRKASIANPKLNLIFGPWANTEIYVNLGSSFHSNDARGTVINIDPKTNERVNGVTPLSRSKGFELGVRTVPLPGLQTSLSMYQVNFDSEPAINRVAAKNASRKSG